MLTPGGFLRTSILRVSGAMEPARKVVELMPMHGSSANQPEADTMQLGVRLSRFLKNGLQFTIGLISILGVLVVSARKQNLGIGVARQSEVPSSKLLARGDTQEDPLIQQCRDFIEQARQLPASERWEFLLAKRRAPKGEGLTVLWPMLGQSKIGDIPVLLRKEILGAAAQDSPKQFLNCIATWAQDDSLTESDWSSIATALSYLSPSDSCSGLTQMLDLGVGLDASLLAKCGKMLARQVSRTEDSSEAGISDDVMLNFQSSIVRRLGDDNLKILTESIAQNNPSLAISLMANLPVGSQSESTWISILSGNPTLRADFSSFNPVLEQTKVFFADPTYKNDSELASRSTLDILAGLKTPAAVERFVKATVAQLLSTAPDAAFLARYTDGVSSDIRATPLRVKIMTQLAGVDVALASEYLNQCRFPDDESIEILLKQIRNDSTAVNAWANKLNDPQIREKWVKSINH